MKHTIEAKVINKEGSMKKN